MTYSTVTLYSLLTGKERMRLPVSIADIESYREIYSRWIEAYEKRVQNPTLGFVPLSFATHALYEAGIKLPPGLDGIAIGYCAYQKCKVEEDGGATKSFPALPAVKRMNPHGKS